MNRRTRNVLLNSRIVTDDELTQPLPDVFAGRDFDWPALAGAKNCGRATYDIVAALLRDVSPAPSYREAFREWSRRTAPSLRQPVGEREPTWVEKRPVIRPWQKRAKS